MIATPEFRHTPEAPIVYSMAVVVLILDIFFWRAL